MNERIKELAAQCYHQYSEHNIDLEKFAELVWQEAYNEGYNAGAEDAILKERG